MFSDKEKLEGISFGRGRKVKNCLLAMLKLGCLLGRILDFSAKSSLEDINFGVIVMKIIFKAKRIK